MGIVTDQILATLNEQIKQHQVVVWFDPESAYAPVAQTLQITDTSILRFDPHKGFLALRRELEPLWGAHEKPRLLIYVPLSSQDSHHALQEYIVSGIKLEPGGHPPETNTRLAVIAKRALENALPPASLEKVIEQVEKGQLSLKEIDEIADKGIQENGALALIFGSGNPENIALRFLTDETIDAEVSLKKAGTTLSDLFQGAFGKALPKGDNLHALRKALGRHLLLVEFIHSLGDTVPTPLQSIPLPESKAARESAVRVIGTWRLRRDLGEQYARAAQALETELAVSGMDWTFESLQQTETFLGTGSILQTMTEKRIAAKPSPSLLELAQTRMHGFWSNQDPRVKLRWQIIAEAGEALLLSNKILSKLKSGLAAGSLWTHYTAGKGDPGETPWCELDTLQRRLERDLNNFDFDLGKDDSLLKLAAAAQGDYARAAQELAQRFTAAYENAGFVLPGVQQQARVFADFVQPALSAGKTAYLLVDAFRYEMARELLAQLPTEWASSLVPAIATPPTITEVGMAALVPGAERAMALSSAGAGKLAVKVNDCLLQNRADRMGLLKNKGDSSMVDTRLNEIAPLKDKHLKTRLSNANLIVITATDEIDGFWENNPSLARQMQEHIFDQLRRGIRSLFGLGVQKVIITADHGFLAGNNLVAGEPVDPPGGDTADLHRRVWVGKGGAAIPNFLRKPISAFGLGGNLEMVTPYGLAVFKSPGGSMEYYHGGLSLQEMVVPVLTISSTSPIETGKPPFHWEMEPGGKKITTRFFSVTIKGSADNLLAAPPRVRVELHSGGQVISQPVAATYGYNESTRDVSMKFIEETPGSLAPNTITLQVTEIPSASKVSLHLLDEIGTTLREKTDIPIDIAI